LIVDPFKNNPGYMLRRASTASMEKLARRLRTLGLRPSEATVLWLIDANPHIRQSEIGRVLNIARANMTPLVARLAKLKLVERRPADGRSHGMWTTASGCALTARIRHALDLHEAELIASIPASHRKGFVAGLRALWPDK
jgi:DNA-binding MarR family transcriptional regulator